METLMFPPLTTDIRSKNSLFSLLLPAPYGICRACFVQVQVSVASNGPCVVDGCPTAGNVIFRPGRLPCLIATVIGHTMTTLPAVFITPTPFFLLPERHGNCPSTPALLHSTLYRPESRR